MYAAIDAVGGELTQQVTLALRDGGTVYVYGALAGGSLQVDTLDMLYNHKRVVVRPSPEMISNSNEVTSLPLTRRRASSTFTLQVCSNMLLLLLQVAYSTCRQPCLVLSAKPDEDDAQM